MYQVLVYTIVSIFLLYVFYMIYQYLKFHQKHRAVSQQEIYKLQQQYPLNQHEIQIYLPKFLYSKLNCSQSLLCNICLQSFLPDSYCRQMICSHIFHKHCIDVWLFQNQNCPTCRTKSSLLDLQKVFQQNQQIENQSIKQSDKTSYNLQKKSNDFSEFQTTNQKSEEILPNNVELSQLNIQISPKNISQSQQQKIFYKNQKIVDKEFIQKLEK